MRKKLAKVRCSERCGGHRLAALTVVAGGGNVVPIRHVRSDTATSIGTTESCDEQHSGHATYYVKGPPSTMAQGVPFKAVQGGD